LKNEAERGSWDTHGLGLKSKIISGICRQTKAAGIGSSS
jgi:hypothetical protein